MDNKEIAKKILSGEDVSTLIKDFTDEQKISLNKEILAEGENAKKAVLEEVTALRKEKNRVNDLANKKPDDPKPEINDQQKQFRSEQVIKAKNRLMSEFGLKPEEMTKVEEAFKTIDSGKIDSDFIFADLKKAYVTVNPDIFIDAKRNVENFQRNAVDALADAANGGGSGAGGNEGKKYSDKAMAWAKEAKKQGIELTAEQAESTLEKGLKRTY